MKNLCVKRLFLLRLLIAKGEGYEARTAMTLVNGAFFGNLLGFHFFGSYIDSNILFYVILTVFFMVCWFLLQNIPNGETI